MIEILGMSLGLTLLLELAYGLLWGVDRKAYSVILLMNVLTNPLVVLWHYGTLDAGIWMHTVLPEALAILTECLILRVTQCVSKPVQLGISINLFSYFFGLVIMILGGNWI